ncbi:hypothetical protein ACFL6L_00520, partial [candidate division KSB1 bacterium]
AFPINNDALVYSIDLKDKSEMITSLIYEDPYKLILLSRFKKPGVIITKTATTYLSTGYLYWHLLDNNRVVYINTDEDTHTESDGSYYIIHILSIDKREDSEIKVSYDPIPYPEDLSPYLRGPGDPSIDRGFQVDVHLIEQAYRDKKYLPSALFLVVDRNYAFIIQHSIESLPGNSTSSTVERPVDVVNLNTGEHIGTFRFTSGIQAIQNGYGYQIGVDDEGYMAIWKFRLSPAMYGLAEDPDWRNKQEN